MIAKSDILIFEPDVWLASRNFTLLYVSVTCSLFFTWDSTTSSTFFSRTSEHSHMKAPLGIIRIAKTSVESLEYRFD